MSQIAKNAALVLAGGGARGAYEVGVIMGVTKILAPLSDRTAPFKIFTGTSVGAINAAFFAAHADQTDLGAAALREIWSSLEWSNQLGFSWGRALRLLRGGAYETASFGRRHGITRNDW